MGVATREDVNVELAEEVGQKILEDMTGNNVNQYVFRKRNQVITPESKSTIKIDGEKVNIDPQLLFQRLVIAEHRLQIYWMSFSMNYALIHQLSLRLSMLYLKPTNQPLQKLFVI